MGLRITSLVLGLIALIAAVPTVFDMAYANALVVSVRSSPRTVSADGQSAALITLRYRGGDGRPRAGDILTMLDLSANAGTIARYSPSASGAFAVIPIYRISTDRQGQATFRYIPPAANPFVATKPARIQVTDTSLGTVLEIDKTTTITIDVVAPRKLPASSGTASQP